jgi:hypothetical protein
MIPVRNLNEPLNGTFFRLSTEQTRNKLLKPLWIHYVPVPEEYIM